MSLVYHYTSIDALHSILERYRDNNCNDFIELWASNIWFLNDPQEMLKAPDIVLNILHRLEKSLNIIDSLRITKTYNDIDSIINSRYKRLLKRDDNLFIFSLSNNVDTLPMWSMYAKNGKGVCLCFDKNELTDYFKQDQEQQVELVPVSYDFDNLENSTMGKLEAIYQQYIEEITDDCIQDKDSVIDNFLYSFIRILAPLYKDPAYRYEGEERLICTQQGYRFNNTIKFRVSSNGYIIPFRIIKIPVGALKKIIIGPSYDYELLSLGLRHEMIISGYVVDLEKSEINYRLI